MSSFTLGHARSLTSLRPQSCSRRSSVHRSHTGLQAWRRDQRFRVEGGLVRTSTRRRVREFRERNGCGPPRTLRIVVQAQPFLLPHAGTGPRSGLLRPVVPSWATCSRRTTVRRGPRFIVVVQRTIDGARSRSSLHGLQPELTSGAGHGRLRQRSSSTSRTPDARARGTSSLFPVPGGRCHQRTVETSTHKIAARSEQLACAPHSVPAAQGPARRKGLLHDYVVAAIVRGSHRIRWSLGSQDSAPAGPRRVRRQVDHEHVPEAGLVQVFRLQSARHR